MSGTRLRLEGGLVRQIPADNTGSGNTGSKENGKDMLEERCIQFNSAFFFLLCAEASSLKWRLVSPYRVHLSRLTDQVSSEVKDGSASANFEIEDVACP